MKKTLKTLVPCALVAVVMVALASSGVYAAGETEAVTITPESVSFTPFINFSGVFQTLIDKLGPLIAAALTIGLGIWGTKFIYNRARSMAR